jgi:hypothetical protein
MHKMEFGQAYYEDLLNGILMKLYFFQVLLYFLGILEV